MATRIEIDGTGFLLNGRPTYEGVTYLGRNIEGLLFNSRMIQAIFDDECPQTVSHWAYPDTGVWDPERNTREFCAALPSYRDHGLLAVTVGLQGGGAVFTPEIYSRYRMSAYTEDGTLKPAYMRRLKQILETADDLGMVVIVNAFYVQQVRHTKDVSIFPRLTERLVEWLLMSGHENILLDVANESAPFWKVPIFEPDNIHTFIDLVKGISLGGRRLLVGSSSGGGPQIPTGKWLASEDFSMPHGNGCTPEALLAKLRLLKDTPEYRRRPRPILINEDSIFLENLEAAIEEYSSWGFYCQGYGSAYQDRMNWKDRPREQSYEELSGFQTVPVNWSINTPIKRAFFERLRRITRGD